MDSDGLKKLWFLIYYRTLSCFIILLIGILFHFLWFLVNLIKSFDQCIANMNNKFISLTKIDSFVNDSTVILKIAKYNRNK